MRKTYKRFLSLLVCAAMVLTSLLSLQFPALAAEGTRYVEVDAFSGDGNYILAVEGSDGLVALSSSSSGGYAEAVSVTEASGEDAAYIETSSTNVVWSYTESDGYLKNGSNYLYPGSGGMRTYRNGREIIFEDGKLHVTTSDGSTYYITYGADGFGTSTDVSAAATFRLFKEGDEEPVEPPTPEDPTRYEEVGAFSGDGEYILAVEVSDGAAALANDSSAGYAETMTITEAAGEEAAYIETDSTKAVWSYTADNGYLKNGSDYVYAGSAGMQTYTSGREIIFEDGKIHVTTRDGSTYYMTYGSDGFGTSNDAGAAATFRLFKEGGGEPVDPPTPVDPTRYEEVSAFSGDGNYILAAEGSDGLVAIANDSSAGYAEAVTVIEATGEEAAYIETSSTNVVWSYTASDGFLKNGSNYLYPGSQGMQITTYTREIIFEDGKLHVTTRDGSTYYMTYGADGFGTSKDDSEAATFRLFKEGGGEPVDPPTPVDPTRYEEVGSLSSDGDYILAAADSDTSVNAIAKSGSSISAQSLTVVPAEGDTDAYIETDSTSVVWSYTESDKFLKNGSDYLYPRSDGNIMAYSSGRVMNYADGHLYFESSSSETYYLTYGESGFATSSDVSAAATFRLFKLGGGEDPVDPPLPTGDAVYVAFTSDVHNGASSSVSSADRLKDWTNIVTGSIGSPFDTFGFCGDLGPASGSSSNFWTSAQGVMDAVSSLVTQGKVAHDGFYVCGNHEYNPGSYTHNSNSTTQRYTDAGGSYDGGDYLLFSMGARQWNEEYSDSDINQMKDFLAAHEDFKKPIIILSHYPLHCYGNYSSGESTSVHDGRAAVGSAKIAAALNEATETNGQTIVYLWGHNHSSNNYYYDEILHSINGIGDVSFTYCAAGCMSDREYGQSGNVKGKGLVVGIYDNYMTMTYYNIDGDPLADPVVIEFQGGEPLVKHTITASAGANGSISPSGEVSVVDGRDKEFTFIPDSGYKVETVLVDGNDVTASVVNNKYTMENVTADHTIEVTFEELPISFYVLTDNFTDGQEYLIVNANSGSGYALRNPGGETEGADLAATAVTIDTTADVDGDGQSDISIAAADADIVWTASASAGRTGAFDLRNNGDYLEGKGGNMNIFKTQQYPARAWEYANSKLQFLGGDYSYVLYYSNNNFTGSNYNASSGSIPSQAGNIYLFEKVESGDLVKYTVTASAGANGKISPSGEVSVIQGRSKNFTFTPDPGYEIDKVLVGGTDVTAQVADNQYTISNITSDTTIVVTFKKAEVTAYKLAETVNTSRKYLVVSNGYALRNNNGEIAATRITEGEDGLIYINNSDDTAAVKWSLVNAVPVGDNLQSGDYTVENSSYKFYRYSDASGNPTPARLTTENPISENSGYPYYQWSYDAENQQLKQVGGQDGSATFYAYYNTSENAFYTASGEQNLGLYIPYEDVDPEWGEPTYEWAADNSTVTAVRVSGSDPSVTETETVEATSKITKDATCEEKGEITYTSAEFKNTAFTVQTKTEEIPALGHNLQHHDAKAATCKEEGNIEYWTCERCGKFFSDADGKTEITEADTVLAKTEHSWNEGVVTTQPTCTEPGVKTYTCSVCGETKTEEIPALGHNLQHHDAKAATCKEEGNIEYWTCERCGKFFRDADGKTEITEADTVLAKTGEHSWNEGVVTTQPTCTEPGVKTYTCSVCGETKTEDIPALGHNLQHHDAKAATCKEEGNIEYWTCERCGKFFSDADGKTEITEADTVLAKTEHSWNEGTITKNATCTEAGQKVYTCSICGETKTEEIPALGHKWTFKSFEWIQNGETYSAIVYYECENDPSHQESVTPEVTVEIERPTCTESGRILITAFISKEAALDGTSMRQIKEETILPLGHKYGEPAYEWAEDDSTVTAKMVCENDASHVETETVDTTVVVTEATCEEAGSKVYTAEFENDAFQTQTKTIEIPATGHDWKFESFNWSKTEDGYTGTASYICRNDAEHKTTADADVTSEKTEATCTEEGSLIYTAVISEEKAPDGAYREYSKEITLTPLGHAYGEPEWTWDGLEAATAVFTCANDATHTETLEAEITTAQGTGEDEGYTVYTAAVVFENKTYTDQKKVINQYTLTFKDGDEVLGVITQDYGTEITAPEDPEKEGFVFQGWDPEVPATMPAQDMTITAKWIVLSYELDKTSIEKLPVGSTEQLTLVGSDGSTGKGTWTSSDENVATVDENGLVTAVKYGKAVIHVVMENGYEADCTVQTRFWDVAGSPNKDDPDYQYYFNAVYWAADHDPLITRGYDLEYFGVGMPCNRQEFILFIYRLANSPSVDTSKLDATFSDVGSLSNTFRKAIAWGSNKGIIKGYTSGENAGKFGKDFPITRKDAMIMLYRYAGKPAPSKAGLDAVKTFTDVQGKFGTTTDTYKAIAWAAGKGITNGYKNQSDIPAEFNYKVPCFGCDMPCMREQMIVFLYRFATQ